MYLKYLTLILLFLSITSLSIAQCPTTNITFNTQAEIDNFPINYPGCTMIPGGVRIDGNFTNLNGLSGITSIGGYLFIFSESSLPNLVGLSGLITVGGELLITSVLTNFDGISNLNSIGGGLTIQLNPALTSVDGLEGLTSIGGDLFIEENPLLANLDGLSALNSVSGGVNILECGALTNIDGLSALTSIGEGLIVISNNALTMCCTLCPLLHEDALDDTVIGGGISIYDNATGCDEADILACTPCLREIESPNIPTVSEWGLMILGLITLIIGVISIRGQGVLKAS